MSSGQPDIIEIVFPGNHKKARIVSRDDIAPAPPEKRDQRQDYPGGDMGSEFSS